MCYVEVKAITRGRGHTKTQSCVEMENKTLYVISIRMQLCTLAQPVESSPVMCLLLLLLLLRHCRRRYPLPGA